MGDEVRQNSAGEAGRRGLSSRKSLKCLFATSSYCAPVAQRIEQGFPKAKVASSILAGGAAIRRRFSRRVRRPPRGHDAPAEAIGDRSWARSHVPGCVGSIVLRSAAPAQEKRNVRGHLGALTHPPVPRTFSGAVPKGSSSRNPYRGSPIAPGRVETSGENLNLALKRAPARTGRRAWSGGRSGAATLEKSGVWRARRGRVGRGDGRASPRRLLLLHPRCKAPRRFALLRKFSPQCPSLPFPKSSMSCAPVGW